MQFVLNSVTLHENLLQVLVLGAHHHHHRTTTTPKPTTPASTPRPTPESFEYTYTFFYYDTTSVSINFRSSNQFVELLSHFLFSIWFFLSKKNFFVTVDWILCYKHALCLHSHSHYKNYNCNKYNKVFAVHFVIKYTIMTLNIHPITKDQN